MLRKDEVTGRVRIVSLPDAQSPFITLVQKAVRPDGKERTMMQKVPVNNADLLTRLAAEAVEGAEIEATIVTEWHKNGYTTYLADFRSVSADATPDTRTTRPNEAIEPQRADTERPVRVAAIHASLGKFYYGGTASEELHRERQADKAKEEQQIRNYRL